MSEPATTLVSLDLIKSASAEYGLDPILVQAITEKESAYRPWAIRYEPNYKYLYFPREHADRLFLSYDTEVTAQKISWGLMQVMGGVAREYGFGGILSELCNPKTGLEYGCRHLKSKLSKYGNESDAIAAYNHGSVEKTSGGMYVNQKYADKIHAILTGLRAIR